MLNSLRTDENCCMSNYIILQLTCDEQADEGQHGLASSIRHGASCLVHFGGQDNGSDDLAHSHLNTSLDQQELATKPAEKTTLS